MASTSQEQRASIDEDEHGYVKPNAHPTYLALFDHEVSEAYANQNELCGIREMDENANRVECQCEFRTIRQLKKF